MSETLLNVSVVCIADQEDVMLTFLTM